MERWAAVLTPVASTPSPSASASRSRSSVSETVVVAVPSRNPHAMPSVTKSVTVAASMSSAPLTAIAARRPLNA
jgi:hypothetical protein